MFSIKKYLNSYIKKKVREELLKQCAELQSGEAPGPAQLQVMRKIAEEAVNKRDIYAGWRKMPPMVNAKTQTPSGYGHAFLPMNLSLNMKAMISKFSEERLSIISTQEAPKSPYSVSLKSKVCEQADIESDWGRYWFSEMRRPLVYHRKFWEHAYIMQTLFEHGMLQKGKRGLGLGCGQEPLPSYFASKGCEIEAGDKPDQPGETAQNAWKANNAYTKSLDSLFHKNFLTREAFEERVKLRYIDMNNLPEEIFGQYDFCWSACVVEHLGNVEAGLAFLRNSLKLLKPGGISVHTLEFNYLDMPEGFDNYGLVAFSRKHVESVIKEITALGGLVAPTDFNWGNMLFDKYMDLFPQNNLQYADLKLNMRQSSTVPMLKVSIHGLPLTSFGMIIKSPA